MLRKLFLITLTICLSFFIVPFSCQSDAKQPAKIFVLHSYSPGFIWTDSITRGIQDTLGKNSELTMEYMDSKLLNSPEYYAKLFDLYRYKYAGQRYQSVICSDDDALQFLRQYGNALFPDTPVVFCGINNYDEKSLDYLHDELHTGVLEDIDIKGTLDTALKLKPQTKQLVVVTDQTTAGIACKNAVLNTVATYFSSLPTTFLDTHSLPDMLQKVHDYSADTLILYMPFSRDMYGNAYAPESIAELISNNSSVPVFSLWDHYLNHGIAGGHLTSGYQQGAAAAKIVSRLLSGEKAAAIPLITESPKDYSFDYRQLSRFGIEKSSLPRGSIVINEPKSFYSQYPTLVWGSVSLFLCLVIIIVLLGANSLTRRDALFASKRLAMIVESSSETIVSLTLDGIILSWNKGAENMYGFTAGEIVGQPVFLLLPPDQHGHMREMLQRISQGEIIKEDHALRRRKDGSIIETARTFSPIKDPSGQIIGISAIVRDITELRKAIKEVHRLNADLERRVADRTADLAAANKELEAFSYSVSHDLRSPLRSIDGFSLALLEDCAAQLDDVGKDYLNRVRSASQRMGTLIDDMLKLSRISRTEMNRSIVDLSSLAQAIARELRQLAPERSVDFQITPGITAAGDEHLLGIVLDNLLGNAWKFTGKKTQARIEFGVCPSTRSQPQPIFFVRDNGAGFDMNYAEKIFGVFQRLHSDKEFAGSGIGLATVQRIIHRHGGKIWAEGQVDQGAVFYFSLGSEAETLPHST